MHYVGERASRRPNNENTTFLQFTLPVKRLQHPEAALLAEAYLPGGFISANSRGNGG